MNTPEQHLSTSIFFFFFFHLPIIQLVHSLIHLSIITVIIGHQNKSSFVNSSPPSPWPFTNTT